MGDHDYKKRGDLPPESQIITANPDIKERMLMEDDEFLVMACDGECVDGGTVENLAEYLDE